MKSCATILDKSCVLHQKFIKCLKVSIFFKLITNTALPSHSYTLFYALRYAFESTQCKCHTCSQRFTEMSTSCFIFILAGYSFVS